MTTTSLTGLQIAGIFLSIIAGLIVIHKFILQRPKIQLKVDKKQDFLFEDGVKSNIQFIVVNYGFKFAENTYMEIRLPDWNFGEQRRRIDWNISISSTDSHENTSNPTDNSDSADDNSDVDNSKESEKSIRKADSVLDIRHDIDTYFLSSGEINHILIDDILYNGTEFKIFHGEIYLEQFETYKIEYSVGCRSYSPRKGEIEFDVGYDEINVNHSPPRFWNAWYSYFEKILRDLNHAVFNFLSSWDRLNFPNEKARVIDSNLEREIKNNSEFIVNPVANVFLLPTLNQRRSVKVKGGIFLNQDDSEDVILGTVTFRAYSLDPGEKWETRPPKQQWRTNKFDYNKEYGGSNLEGALPINITVPEGIKKPNIRVDWTVDAWKPRSGNTRGLNITNCDFDENLKAAKGTVENGSSSDVTFFIIAKFYTEDDTILTTAYSEYTVEAESDEDFSVMSDLNPDQNDRLESCKCIISNAL